MKFLLPVLAAVLATPDEESLPAAADFDHDHAAWTEVLQAYVKPGGFDYAGLKRDRSKLDAYLAALESVTPGQLEGWTREQRFAFWINMYNAHTVGLVAEHYPIVSIRSLGTVFQKVWDKEIVPLPAFHPDGDNDPLSLDDVEHKILRPQFRDARVHVAVNCASVSCPPLRPEAFVADRLDEQLDDQARRWLQDTNNNSFDRTATKIHVSRIFEWFATDFERDEGSAQAWIGRYAPARDSKWIRTARNLSIEYREYDWNLNDASSVD